MVELAAIFKFEDEAAGVADIAAVFDTGAVDGMGHRDLDALHIHAAAFVDASGILYAFGLETARQLGDGDHAWSGGFGDIDSIRHGITVALRDEHGF